MNILEKSDKKKNNEEEMKAVNISMEDSKNQNHNSKKEGLGPNTNR